MTDRELLGLAAKAAGIPIVECTCTDPNWPFRHNEPVSGRSGHWNPVYSDADALRLAAALHIDIEWQATCPIPEPAIEAYQRNDSGSAFCASEPEADYRRAIVRAAAEIGKGM